MADTSSLKKGITIKHNNKIYFVIDVNFMKPGRGGAYYRTKLRDIEKSSIVKVTFKSGEGVELVDTERRNLTYLYQSGEEYVFMDDDSFEQYHYDADFVGEDIIKFLKEEQKLIVLYAENEPVNIVYPVQKLEFKVTDAPPGLKGDTASGATKLVTIETGATIQTPLFIQNDDVVVVNVETGEYCGKQK